MGGSDDERASGAGSPHARRFPRLLSGAVMMLCFGLLGLVLAALPAARRRRREQAAACTVCHRQQRVGRVAVTGFAVLLIVGAGVRTAVAAGPLDECSGRFTMGAQEALAEGPSLDEVPQLAPAATRWWGLTRATVTAPTSGVMLAATTVAGMRHCSGSAVLVAFPPPPAPGGGGSVVGDVFVSWISEVDGAGVVFPGQETYVQFDSNVNAEPEVVEAIARHESRHVDQWTVATLVGGPLALPAGYYVDSLFFPLSRNHFERNAGLEDGGYDVPPDFGPSPLWWPLVVTTALLLLVLRRRIRLWSRAIVADRAAAPAHEDGRCPLHGRGWFRDAPTPLRLERADG